MKDKRSGPEWFKTKYKGIYYTIGKRLGGKGEEKIYYARYRKDGKHRRSKIGRQYKDAMTAAVAARKRALLIEGKELSNKEKREIEKEKANRWTINRLWEEYKKNKTTFKGEQRDESRFRVHILPEFGEKEVNDIITLDIDRFRKRLLKDKGLSPQTAKNTLELLRRICNFGFKKDLIPRKNIRFEMPATDNVIIEVLTNEQIKNLLTVLNENPMNIEAWLLKVMLYTGRRTGEICALEWSDIDFNRQVFTLKDTKTGKTEQLPFSDRAKELFESMPRFHDRFVFPNTDGSRRSRVDKHSRDFRMKAGIPDSFRPSYSLRHTFASIAASNDVPERVLKALLGHASKEGKKDITSRYAHVSKERLLRAANQIAIIIDEILLNSPKFQNISTLPNGQS